MVFNEEDVEVSKKYAIYVYLYGEPETSFEKFKSEFLKYNAWELVGLTLEEQHYYIYSKYDKFIAEQKEMLAFFLQNFDSCFEQIVDERQRIFLAKKFGLFGGEAQTLASIGKEYNLSVERVRQIIRKGSFRLNNKIYNLLQQKMSEEKQKQ